MAYLKFHFAPTQSQTAEGRQKAKKLGVTGEQMALRYLEDQGYVVIEHNYRHGHKEVDIIALDGGELVFIEVKTRTSEEVVVAEQAVDHQKRQNIIRVADSYVCRHHRTEPVRFDIITVVSNGKEAAIKHIKNAFNTMQY